MRTFKTRSFLITIRHEDKDLVIEAYGKTWMSAAKEAVKRGGFDATKSPIAFLSIERL